MSSNKPEVSFKLCFRDKICSLHSPSPQTIWLKDVNYMDNLVVADVFLLSTLFIWRCDEEEERFLSDGEIVAWHLGWSPIMEQGVFLSCFIAHHVLLKLLTKCLAVEQRC